MTVFAATGANQSYVVPAGVNYIQAELIGAEGGYRKSVVWGSGASRGGAGACVRSVHKVTPGETITVVVGKSPNSAAEANRHLGGFNGGGASTWLNTTDGGQGDAGGGATDIRRGSALAGRIAVAGGGGGNGSLEDGPIYIGGDAGNQGGSGGRGTSYSTQALGGYGGTATAGGVGGTSSPSGTASGANGALGVGGKGANSAYTGTGGGGGGGLYGGGGGGTVANQLTVGAGGGGGSSSVIGAGNMIVAGLVGYNYTGAAGAIANGDGRATLEPYTPPVPLLYAPTSVVASTSVPFVIDFINQHPNVASTGRLGYEIQVSRTNAFIAGNDTLTFTGFTSQNAITAFATIIGQGTWFARARTAGNENLPLSGWTAAQQFSIAHQPSASIVSPTADVYINRVATTPMRFAWSDQFAADTLSAYEIVIEDNSTGSVLFTTGKVASVMTSSPVTINAPLGAALDDTKLRWRVRVWDSGDVASAWSSYGIFTLTTPPVVTITSPANGATVTTGAPTFTWTNAIPGGRKQISAKAVVTEVATGLVVWTGSIATAGSVTPSSTVLVNGTNYVLTVTVTDDIGLVGEKSHTFSTSYVSPDPITYDVIAEGANDLGYVLVDWSATAPDPAIVAWRVYRRELPNAEWSLVEEINDSARKTWKDYLVKSGSSYMYNITQVADRSGALLESPVGSRTKRVIAATVANLFTNPAFEATSGTVEVRRNHSVYPAPISAADYSYSVGDEVSVSTLVTGATDGPLPGITRYIRRTVTTARTTPSAGGFYSYNRAPAAPAVGDNGIASVYVRSSSAIQMALVTSWRTDAGVTVGGAATGPTVTLVPGVWTRLEVQPVVATEGATNIGWWATVRSSTPPLPDGATLDITGVLTEKSMVIGQYFDGSFSPDSDLTPSWTGTATASASILTGALTTNTTHGGTRTISSLQWALTGARSIRLIPISTSTSTYSDIGGGTGAMRNGMVAGRKYTVLCTCRVLSLQKGSLDPLARRIVVYHRAGSTGAYTAISSYQAPNESGEHEVRLTFNLPSGTTEAFVRLFNGASVGGGDVWWDNFALIEGEYNGLYFDGSTGAPAGLQGFATRWRGTKDASASELYDVPVVPEARAFYIDTDSYWIIAPDVPELTMKIPGVNSDSVTEQYESQSYNIIGRGRHVDYGDRLGYSGTLSFSVRIPESPSTVKRGVERLRMEQETYFLRTPFGALFPIALGDPTWSPLAGVGNAEMGDMTLPYIEVAD